MNQARSKSIASAFTLIEVLLAVSVFAIVLAAINSVFFSALRLRNKTSDLIESALPIQQSLQIIQKDFEGLLAPGGKFAGKFTTTTEGFSNSPVFLGERVTPDLYTTSGNVSELATWSDVQKVAYFLALPTNATSLQKGKEVIRQVTRNLLPVTVEESEAQFLMSGVQFLRLQYYDGLSWTDTWDSNTYTNLPRAVKLQLTLAADYEDSRKEPAPIELVVPIIVQSATNTTTEGTTGGTGQ